MATSDLRVLREQVRQSLWRLGYTDNDPERSYEQCNADRIRALEDLVEWLVEAVFKLAPHPTDRFGEPVELDHD